MLRTIEENKNEFRRVNSLKISFISGLYNCESTIVKCINSLISQLYSNIEIVLVVNASYDRTEEIAKNYEEKYPNIIKVIVTKEKLGCGGSRSKGMELATGDYVCFVDCDDYISKDYILEMVRFAKKMNFPDIVIVPFTKVDESEKEYYTRIYKDQKEAIMQSIAPWGKMFKRNYIQDKEIMIPNIPFGEDIALAAEIYLSKPQVALHMGSERYFWVNHLNSTSHTELRHFPNGVLNISKQYFEYLKRKYPKNNNEICYFMTKYYVWYLLQSGRNTKIKEMRREAVKAVKILEEQDKNWYKKKIKLNGERKIVLFAIGLFKLLRKIRVHIFALEIYAKLPMERLWPSL